VFVGSVNNILVSAFSPGIVHYSHDAGVTWGSVSNNNWIREIIPGNNNNIAYLLSGDWPSKEHVWISTDLGVTWKQQPGQVDADTHSFDIGPSCDSLVVYAANEEYSFTAGWDGRSQIWVSYDLGNTWKVTADYASKYFAGSVAVGSSVAYCQTVSEANAGSIRTTDHGLTWTNAGGPSSSGDTRLITALDDNHVVACGVDGSIWVTVNSGGDSVLSTSNAARPIAISKQFATISACIDTSLYNYLSIGCAQFRLDSVRIEADTAHVFKLDTRQTTPRLLDYNKSDSVHVIFHPDGRGGTFGARLHLIGTVIGGGSFDTVLEIHGSANSNGPPLPVVTSTPFALTTSCNDGDGYALVRVGCTQFQIDSAKVEQDTANVFKVDPLQHFPHIVNTSKADTVHVIFHPNHRLGGFGARLHIYGTSISTGLPYDTVITLLAGSIAPTPNFYSTSYQIVWTIPECSSGDTTITFVNKGCDSVHADSLRLAQGTALTSQGVTLPRVVPPNGSITMQVHFAPQGMQTDSLFTWLYYSSPGFHDSIKVPVRAQTAPAPPSLFANHTAISFGVVPSCKTLDTVITLTNKGCDSLTIVSVSNLGGGFSFEPPLVLPILLAKGESVQLRVRYVPKSSSDVQNITIGTSHGNKTASITIALNGRISITTLDVSTPQVNMSAIAICRDADTSITISNPGCDTITITSADLKPIGDLQLVGVTLPIILYPGSVTVLQLHFSAQQQESINGVLTLQYHIRNLSQETVDIPIVAIATPTLEAVDRTGSALQMQQVKICDSKVIDLSYTNRSCDTLYFRIKDILGDADFRILNAIDSIALPMDSTITIRIEIDPQKKGTRNTAVRAVYWNRFRSTGIHDWVTDISADILDGSGHIESSLPSADLGTLTLCNSADTTVTLSNSGCDTLIVTGVLDNAYFDITPINFPLRLPPDSLFTWRLSAKLDTTGRPASRNSNLTFTTSKSDNQINPIPLSYNIRYADPLLFTLVPLSNTAFADSAVYYDIRYPTGLAKYGVSNVRFNLHANSDLLTYENYQSKNSVNHTSWLGNGVENYIFDISGAPMQQDADGTIARVWFKSYLTVDTKTAVWIDSVRLNPDEPDFERCTAYSLGRIDTSFALTTDCGSHIFQEVMKGEKLSLRIVQQGERTLLLIHSPLNESAHVAIINVIGSPVGGADLMLTKGENSYAFERVLPEGPLFVTLSSAAGYRSHGRFVHLRQ